MTECYNDFSKTTIPGTAAVITLLDDIRSLSAYLSGGLHSLPHTEVADEPDNSQTKSQLPADRSQLV